MTRPRALAAALAVALGVACAGCEPPGAGPPADCHSPSPYSLYDRPGHGVEGLVQITCDPQPQSYNVHVSLEYKYTRLGVWHIRDHAADYFTSPNGPVVGHLYEYSVGTRCQEGYWRMVVYAQGVSSDGVPQKLRTACGSGTAGRLGRAAGGGQSFGLTTASNTNKPPHPRGVGCGGLFS